MRQTIMLFLCSMVLLRSSASGCKNTTSATAVDGTHALYVLPYPVGDSYLCSQGFRGAVSHHGSFEYAVDFNMPVRALVTAARAGTVHFVLDGNRDDDRSIDRTNVVVVAHADGTFSRYCHLTHAGALVKLGQRVAEGDPIGLSGMSGSGYPLPHLHFDVAQNCAETSCQTIPFYFRNTIPQPHGPQPGTSYLAIRFH